MSVRAAAVAWLVVGCGAVATAQAPAPLTPKALEAALASKPAGAEAEKLAGQIRSWFGGPEVLVKGAPPKLDELAVAWAIDATPPAANDAAVRVVADVGGFILPLTRVGETSLYAGVGHLAHGAALSWHYEVGDRRAGGGQLEAYEVHPDSREHPGVPRGTVKQMPPWASRIFDGTTRDWWVYVPAQYKPESPAAVMVFQDGAGYKDFVPTVFDNLIARGDMPVDRRRLHPARHSQGRPPQPQLRVRHAVGSIRAVPARGDPARGREDA